MTTMGDAFERAGFKPVGKRLRDMMAEAVAAGGGKYDSSHDYFVAALARARDPDLLWELFAPVRESAIRQLFADVVAERREVWVDVNVARLLKEVRAS